MLPDRTGRSTYFIQAKWDIEELHRHPDFAPIKKEPPAPSRPVAEDDDLPPPWPMEPAKNSTTESNAIFDGDGEFGSMCLLAIFLKKIC